jgi:DJ-1/PfpI family
MPKGLMLAGDRRVPGSDVPLPAAAGKGLRLVLAAPGVLDGRRSADYPALEPDVADHGAVFVESEAVVDGMMVSARAWPDHPGWMRAFISPLHEHAPVEGRQHATSSGPSMTWSSRRPWAP